MINTIIKLVKVLCFLGVAGATTVTQAQVYADDTCQYSVSTNGMVGEWTRIVSEMNRSLINNGDVLYRRQFTETYSVSVLDYPFTQTTPLAGFNIYANVIGANAWSANPRPSDGTVFLANNGVGYRLKVVSSMPSGTKINNGVIDQSLSANDVLLNVPLDSDFVFNSANPYVTFTVTWEQELIMVDKEAYDAESTLVIPGSIATGWGDQNAYNADGTTKSFSCFIPTRGFGLDSPRDVPLDSPLEPFVSSTCRFRGGASSMEVKLDDVPLDMFLTRASVNNAYRPGTKFAIPLECEDKVNLKVTFSDAHPVGSNNNFFYARNADEATATGVGVQLVYLGGLSTSQELAIQLSTATKADNYAAADGTVLEETLENIRTGSVLNATDSFKNLAEMRFEARYFRTENKVTTGTVQAAMIAHFFYE